MTSKPGSGQKIVHAAMGAVGQFILRSRGLRFAFAAIALALCAATSVDAANIVVNSTGDAIANDGQCTLREAIRSAKNISPPVGAGECATGTVGGANTISFNITGAGCDAAGVCTIAPATQLPTVGASTTIDGYTQPGASVNTLPVGNNAVLKVELSGQNIPGLNGLALTETFSSVRGLVVNRFTNGVGITVTGTNVQGTVTGNFVGTNAAGTAALPNRIGILVSNSAVNVQVGTDGNGTGDAAERNLASGNSGSGIALEFSGTSSNRVAGNYIGTNAAGTAPIANGTGISILGAPNIRVGTDANGTADTAERNVISGNSIQAVLIQNDLPTGSVASGNIIAGNYVGTNAAGTAAVANGNGIVLTNATTNNRVGGTAAGAANTIAFNTNDGVQLSTAAGTGNAILSNSIHSNGTTSAHLGIDLGPDGVTANDVNDPDSGPNNLQNFPVLSAATKSGATTTVTGTLGSVGANYRIEFFSNASCDAGGNGEGRTYLGALTGVQNKATFTFTTTTPAIGEVITATATNESSNNTSEFSACRAVVAFNSAPTASASPNPATTNEDTPVTITLTGTDAEDQNLTYTITAQPGKGLLGSVSAPNCSAVNTCTATVTYTPGANNNGADSFKFRVNDGALNSAEVTVNINITAVNDVPTASASPNPATTHASTAVSIALTGVDVEDSNLTFAVTAQPTNGTVSAISTPNCSAVTTCFASVTYTPNAGYVGADSFKFRVNDGTANSAEVTVTINVTNAAPTASASPNPATTFQATPVAITLRATDTDDSNLTFAITTSPTSGTLSALSAPSCSAGTCTASVTYTPNTGYAGADSFKFRANDGTANSAEVAVNITVAADVTAFVVTKTADTNDGVCNTDCSLREAITAANADPGAETISFNVTGPGCDSAGVCTIAPTSALPSITSPMTIDGYTQSGASANTLAVGNNAVLKIEVNGQSSGGANGLTITAGNTTVRGLVINRFGSGILMTGASATGNIIVGNFVGTNAAGTAALANSSGIGMRLGATNNRVGTDGNGTGDEAERNLVSGNTNSGIFLQDAGTSGNTVAGNYIGTNATGTAALANNNYGIFINAASNNRVGTDGNGAGDLAERNLISGNTQMGMLIGGASGTNGNIIAGNYVGTNAAGTAALPNAGQGIYLWLGAMNNRIGGTAASEGNTIAFNGNDGVYVDPNARNNAILSNSIYSNGTTAAHLGIDLGSDGVTANDAGDGDTGANNLQNFPVLSSAANSSGTTTVTGTLDSTVGATFRIEFFSNASCDTAGNGEGRTYLGALTNVQPNVGFTFATTTAATGEFITATATDLATNDTSEFSACVAVTSSSAAEIAVFTGANTEPPNERTNGAGTFDFGGTTVGSTSASRTFTIQNIGNDTLTGLALSKTGANAAEFSLGILGATTLAPNATTTFTVTFAPTSRGPRAAAVHIASNDADENPFTINVAGVGRTALESWRQFYFGTTDNTGNAANGNDNDFDGHLNLEEFVYGGDPTKADISGVLIPKVDAQGRLVLEFKRRKALEESGITLEVQTGPNLTSFAPLDLSNATIVSLDDTFEQVTVTDPVITPSRFGRIRVTDAYVNNFNAGLGAAVLRGNATWTNGAVRLTDNAQSQMGAVVVDGLTAGAVPSGFVAKFTAAIGPTAGTPADGLSFAVGNLGATPWGENGPGTSNSLAIGFDTYEDSGIHVWLNGSRFTSNATNPYTNGVNVPVEVSYDPASGLTVRFNGTAIFTNLTVPGVTFPANTQFGWGARTGGLTSPHIVDNVEIAPQ